MAQPPLEAQAEGGTVFMLASGTCDIFCPLHASSVLCGRSVPHRSRGDAAGDLYGMTGPGGAYQFGRCFQAGTFQRRLGLYRPP